MRRVGRLLTVIALGAVGLILQTCADPIADLLWAPREDDVSDPEPEAEPEPVAE